MNRLSTLDLLDLNQAITNIIFEFEKDERRPPAQRQLQGHWASNNAVQIHLDKARELFKKMSNNLEPAPARKLLHLTPQERKALRRLRVTATSVDGSDNESAIKELERCMADVKQAFGLQDNNIVQPSHTSPIHPSRVHSQTSDQSSEINSMSPQSAAAQTDTLERQMRVEDAEEEDEHDENYDTEMADDQMNDEDMDDGEEITASDEEEAESDADIASEYNRPEESKYTRKSLQEKVWELNDDSEFQDKWTAATTKLRCRWGRLIEKLEEDAENAELFEHDDDEVLNFPANGGLPTVYKNRKAMAEKIGDDN